MSKFFLTNPDDVSDELKNSKRRKVTIDFKEQVSSQLQHLGVPFIVADLAVIDLGFLMKSCRINKLSPSQTADMLIGQVKERYTNEDGTWHYV